MKRSEIVKRLYIDKLELILSDYKENNIEFMLSATILANKNKIFNDNIYEYDTISLPFLGELGRQLYEKSRR